MNQLQVNTPTFILYLTDKVKNFKAGCIAEKLMVWSSLTTDTEILSTVSGLPLEFESIQNQQIYASTQSFSSEESKFIGTEINNLLQKNVIKNHSMSLENSSRQYFCGLKMMGLLDSY